VHPKVSKRVMPITRDGVGDHVFLKISSIRRVMRFEKEGEIGIQGCLTPDFIKYDSFSKDYIWTVYIFLFG
jgi:hypothetical protein